jgi:natural product biosynthesis luciferase-like monooxygenase protein/amino acid adenylation domain-containing protein/FkbM family methyltransferase
VTGEVGAAGAAHQAERAPASLDLLVREAAKALRTGGSALDPARPLTASGLDSLAAVELCAAVEAHTGVALPLAALLEGATLAELAAAVDGKLAAAEAGAAPGGRLVDAAGDRPGDEAGEHPPSHGQRALWFVERLAPDSAAYNLAAAARLDGGLDPDALRRAFAGLVERHPALRTTFAERRGELTRLVHADLPLDWRSEAPPALPAIVEAAAWQPFDLERGPLLRVRLWPLGDGSHLLLVAVHHLVADFDSLAVMLRELGEFYLAARAGTPARLAAPPAGAYGALVRAEQALLAGPRGDALWRYWRQQLAGELPVEALPSDRPRPAQPRAEVIAHLLRLGSDEAGRLHGWAARSGATFFALLLAGFQALLHRYTGQRDVVAGTPVSLRTGSPDDRDAVGYYVNPVVLRTDLGGAPTAAALLARSRATALAALAHRDLPFAVLAERLQPRRDAGRPALFQALLVLPRTSGEAASAVAALSLGDGGARLPWAGLWLEPLAFGSGRAPFEITLTAVAEGTGECTLALQLAADLFDRGTGERVLRHLTALLAAMAAQPERPIAELPLLSAVEVAQLATWNDTASPLPPEACVHGLFAAQAARIPDAVALVDGCRRWTYGELDRRTELLAARLRAAGVGPETRVAVCAGRCGELVMALLGVWRAGGAYVPIDPAYPPERLAWMIRDARAAVLLAESRRLRELPDLQEIAAAGMHTLPLDAAHEAAAAPEHGPGPATGPAAAATGPETAATGDAGRGEAMPENLAYLIYTSGSTGRPKGVAIEHRSAVALVAWAAGAFSEAELGGVLAATSIGFDLSVFELFVPLCLGGRVILAENVLALPALPGAGEVRLINTVPSAMTELARAGRLPASVVTVNLAGEPLRRELVKAVAAASPGCRVINLYGPSEATTYATWVEQDLAGAGEPTLGWPIANTRAHLLDAELRPVPVGVAGEVCLGGASLARGYFGRPDLTAERFVPAPPGGVPGEPPGARIYRTGDLARRRPHGDLELLGRRDQQVKIRGYRIELGEVEAALAACPEVRQAAVLARDGGPGDRTFQTLVAYVAPSADRFDPAPVREALRRSLPEVMVPSAFVALAELPRTASGKVDRRALAAIAPEPPRAAAGVPPRTPLEAELAAIWAAVLGRERIGVEDDFFALGGHSLKAMQVLARVRDACGVELPVRSLFAGPTVAQQAALLAPLRLAGRLAEAVARIRPRPPGAGPPPLSFAQERLWFLDQLQPASAAYNIPAALRLRGPLRADLLAHALARIAGRHETLRTSLVILDGVPRQVIAADAVVRLPRLDLRRLPETARRAEARRRVDSLARRPFALGRAPLLRAQLLRLGDAEHVLALCCHHVIADAWSLGVLLRELGAHYAAAADAFGFAGLAADNSGYGGLAAAMEGFGGLPELTVQYADFALWQRERLTGDALERQLAFWRHRLAGLPALELPADRPRPAVASFRGTRRAVRLAPRLLAAVQALCRREGVTLFVALLTAWELLLHRASGQDDVATGTIVANRGRTELEALIGLFANTLVLRAACAAASCSDLLAQLRDAALDAYAHQEMPFEALVSELNPERDLARNPLVQTLFSLQNAPLAADLPGTGLAVERLAADSGAARLDLFLLLWEESGGLTGELEYATDLFDAGSAARLLQHYETLLEALAAGPDRAPADLPLLGGAELHQLLVEWNDEQGEPRQPTGEAAADEQAADSLAPAATVHQQIAAQAGRTPSALAIVCGQHRLTWRELDAAANRLARHLRARGVGPDTRAGVCLQRSAEMVVALLAVLKAGGAYVPLDPDYPRERLGFTVRDAGLAVVVSDRAGAGLFAGLPVPLVRIDAERTAIDSRGAGPLRAAVTPDSLAYVIYTSGSTGRPKGVMITHRNVTSFFAAMDQCAGGAPGRWLAVTSISFDISVLELLWTLGRGATVVIQRAEPAGVLPPGAAIGAAAAPLAHADRPLELSLFYFASQASQASDASGTSDASGADRPAGSRYRLLLEGAKLADRRGFTAVWTPERHFHAFGGLYPNPSVTGAAIAAVTERVAIRAGSVVLPLHNPIRVAEEWAVVDNLSGGRAGISFASGWNPADFALAPEAYASRRELMVRYIDVVRRLWRGEAVACRDGSGRESEVRILPRPIQPELPCWVTAAGSAETFRLAGTLGAGLLTHLLGQSARELAEKIAAYRQAWRAAGHAGGGHVTLMLHTFLGEDVEEVRAAVRGPLMAYLASSLDLLRGLVPKEDLEALDGDQRLALLDRAFDRYFEGSGLFGTPESCLPKLDGWKGMGVDEIACLIDFGIAEDRVLASLELLADARERCQPGDGSIPEQVLQHAVSHLQCTPSAAIGFSLEPAAPAALARLERLLVGGEALPQPLAARLGAQLGGELLNMYGPTETTVWSACARISPGDAVTLGRPLANSAIHLLDPRLRPVPIGQPGELAIGGAGVARGYWQRPALTAERFLPDPFAGRPGARLYRTGDLGRRLDDGRIVFLGRLDQQVKLRGQRIELGEIEAVLAGHPAVREAAAAVRGDSSAGEPHLVAYLVPAVPAAGLVPAVPAADLVPAAAAAGEGPGRRATEAELARILDGHSRHQLPNGLVVAQLADAVTRAMYHEVFDQEIYLRHGVALGPGAVVLDVGANIGLFTLFVHSRVAGARVYAFEPIAPIYQALRANAALHAPEARVFHLGLSDREEEADFTFYPRMAGLSGRFAGSDEAVTAGIVRRWLEASGETLPPEQELDDLVRACLRGETHRCRLRSLSAILREEAIATVDLLKLDVEKSELLVLEGLAEEDWGRIRQIAAEIHGVDLLERIQPLLTAHGFEVAVEELIPAGEPADLVHMLYAVRPGGPLATAAATAAVPLSPAAVEEWLRSQLPRSMWPDDWVVLAALPRTPNGKLDRKALPAPATAPRHAPRAGESPAAAPPRTGTERALVEIWRELLRLPSVGIDDNFFALGGNSLKSMQLRSRIRTVFGLDLSLRALFEEQTIARQGAALEQLLRAGGGSAAAGTQSLTPSPAPAAIARAPRDRPLPLSLAQQRLWVLSRLDPDSPIYNLSTPLLAAGDLDATALRRAFAAIVARHEALRTTFQVEDGQPVQVIARALPPPLPLVDLCRLAAGRRHCESLRLAREDARRPFDLERGPLLRTTLLRLQAGGQETAEHALLLSMHHVAADGESLTLMLAELAAFYGAARRVAAAAPAARQGLPAPEPAPAVAALAIQYADYAVWQRAHAARESLAEPLAWWRACLQGAPATVELPLDRPRPALRTASGASRQLHLDGAAVERLRELGRRESASLFMVLLAAFAALLRRLTGQDDLVVGTPTASRPLPEVEPLIGYFANNLVLRLDAAGDPPFRDLLAGCRDRALAAYAREIPFELLIEELRPERNLGHNPFYQVVFALEGTDRPELALPGVRLTPLAVDPGTAKFDLALYAGERPDRMDCLLEHSLDLFDRATAARLLRHFAALLGGAAAAPGCAISGLPMLDAAERHQLLIEANDTARAAPRQPFVHRRIAAVAAERPGAPAVSGGGHTLSYGELDRGANRLARRLAALGVRPETPVAVALDRSPELIVAMLGIWKAGGAYVPLDPVYPKERLAFMLADSRAAVLITRAELAADLAPGLPQGTSLLLAERGGGGILGAARGQGGNGRQSRHGDGEPADDSRLPEARLLPGNLAYIIYTSGSTGRPKGVMIEHGSLASYVDTAIESYGIEPADRVLQFCSTSFDISIEEIVPCLTRGAELLLRDDAMLASIPAFLAACDAWQLTMLSLPTAWWHEIAAALPGSDASRAPALPPSLRLAVIAGERALPERLTVWQQRAAGRPRLVNTFGLTESTIISTVGELTSCDMARLREVPIGRVIADTELHLLTPALAPVPLGVAAELYIGGGLLARGYHRRPEITAERFLPHPASAASGARLYRTGDLARRRADGELEYLGRGDEQHKIRGYRIELGEIEAALAGHPGLSAAAVAVEEPRPGEPRVVGYVVARREPAPRAGELQSFLRRALPEYMVPAAFVFLPRLPLTANGKLDRAALAGAPGVPSEPGADFLPPRDDLERAVAEVWRRALGAEQIGIDQNFFDLGGHSLALIRVQDGLRGRFGRDLPLVELFRAPTVAAMARLLAPAHAAAAADAAASTTAHERQLRERAARMRAAAEQPRFAAVRGRERARPER